jgi:PKD repeat protein
MKKIILLLALSFTLYQANAQQSACAYTYTQSGNSVTFNHLWPLALIYTLDSVRFDFGDGNTLLHTLPVPISTNHTYIGPGTYNACLTRYISQIGSNIPIICTYCDSITIGQSSGCSTTINTTSTATSIVAVGAATGGTAPYTFLYNLNPGNISNATGVFTGLTPGTYTVCVVAIDAMQNTCSVACDSVTIGNNIPCSTTIQTIVNGNTILASGTALGGQAPYTYSYTLNPGNVTNSTGLFNGLANGAYSICVTATDALNNICSIDCDSAFIGMTSTCAASIQSTASGNTITSIGSATGGTPPYSYSYNLNPGNVTNTTGVFPGLAGGLYTVCVTAIDGMQNVCSIACDSAFVNTSSSCATTVQASTNGTTITAVATATGGSAPYTYTYTLNPGSITNSTGIFNGLTPGAYLVCATAFDAMQNVCSTDCDSAFVTNTIPSGCVVNANFSESISGLNVNFSDNSSITNGTITNYGWSFGDGNVSTAPSPSNTYAAAGTYTVVLAVTGYDTNQVLCVDSFSKTISVAIPSSVNNVKKQELNIYPNPTAKNITMELPINEKFENLLITDVSGRKIAISYEFIDTKKLSISLKNQSTGIYFIKLQTDEHIYTSSIMKQE